MSDAPKKTHMKVDTSTYPHGRIVTYRELKRKYNLKDNANTRPVYPSWTDDPVKDAERWNEYLEACDEYEDEENRVHIFDDEEGVYE